MTTRWLLGLIVLGGQSGCDWDCNKDLDEFPVVSFTESAVWTECYLVSVCDDGAFDWVEPMSESGTFFQYDSQGSTTWAHVGDDVSTRRRCDSWSYGDAREPCSDLRLARGCVVPNAPREPVEAPLEDVDAVRMTLEEMRASTTCRASASCMSSAGVLLEVWSSTPQVRPSSFEQPFSAGSTLAVYDVTSGELTTTAHLRGPSLLSSRSETGWLFWDGPEEPACLDATFTLTGACEGTLGVPDAIEALWSPSL